MIVIILIVMMMKMISMMMLIDENYHNDDCHDYRDNNGNEKHSFDDTHYCCTRGVHQDIRDNDIMIIIKNPISMLLMMNMI